MLLRRLLSSEASLGTSSAKTLSSFYARTPGAHGFASSAQVTEFLGTTTKKVIYDSKELNPFPAGEGTTLFASLNVLVKTL